MKFDSMAYGLIAAKVAGVERKKALQLSLLAGVAEAPPVFAAMLAVVFARNEVASATAKSLPIAAAATPSPIPETPKVDPNDCEPSSPQSTEQEANDKRKARSAVRSSGA